MAFLNFCSSTESEMESSELDCPENIIESNCKNSKNIEPSLIWAVNDEGNKLIMITKIMKERMANCLV